MYGFVEWQKANGTAWNFSTDTVTANITLTAHWKTPTSLVTVDRFIVLNAIAYINSNVGTYMMIMSTNADTSARSIGEGVHLTIIGMGEERKIQLDGNGGRLFNLSGSNRSLTLGNNITIAGVVSNTDELVRVAGGASFTMETGSRIIGNISKNADSAGAVVVTGSGSTFTMKGGDIINNATTATGNSGAVLITGGANFTMEAGTSITNNTSRATGSAGGVAVTGNNSVFTMNGGRIVANTVTDNPQYTSSTSYSGGGVHVTGGGVFTMSDGEIFGNIVNGGTTANYNYNGGGVVVTGNGSVFTMDGGKIFGNTVYRSSSAGGVFIDGTTNAISYFNMNSGEISGNTANAESSVGGVFIRGRSEFTMGNGSAILRNTANGDDACGGIKIAGVNAGQERSLFTMYSGEISNNSATGGKTQTGGLWISNNATFRIVSGLIDGTNNASGNGSVKVIRVTTQLPGAESTTAEHGTFSTPTNPATWKSSGNISSTNNRIMVSNGQLQ